MNYEIDGNISETPLFLSVDLTNNNYEINSDFGVFTVVNYLDVLNKPKINGVELIGDKPLSDFGIFNSTIGYEVIQDG